MESGAFFPKENFVCWWGLRPRPWAGPDTLAKVVKEHYLPIFRCKHVIALTSGRIPRYSSKSWTCCNLTG